MSVDSAEFRAIMGNFATGVTVITTAAGGRLHGMTANAIASLSLDPVMVLICVDKDTHTHGMLDEGRVFAVNILTAEQEAVSRVFATKSEPEPGSLRGHQFRMGETGAPILEGCLAYLDCRVKGVLEGGDHSIFLGEVIDQAMVSDAPPLLFFRGKYRELAQI
jgi:flavin reductase (DIM6/NTAB) family NADH-FMN oxidoreductase RutF